MEKLVRFDWAIKKLLRDKANFDILEGFLTALLCEDIAIVNLLESESNKEDEADKFNRVDLLVENSKQELIIIEVQVKSEQDFFHRIAYGTAKLLAEYLNKGQAYQNIKKIISINITYFDLGVGNDYLYYGSTNFVGVHDKDILSLTNAQSRLFAVNEVSKIFPEYYIIRVEKFADEINTAIDEWVYMLKHDVIKPGFKSKNIQQVTEKLRVMGLKEAERKAYNQFMDNMSYHASMIWSSQQEGRLEGIQEGMEKGREENQLTMVKNSLQQGLEVTVIAAITGLSVEEIKKIQADLQLQIIIS
jgi:predicted transposase/invertase (TIGR01784 family)